MQYEDIVYKAGILAMAVRLEGFLVREWEKRAEKKSGRVTLSGDKSESECPTKFTLVDEFLNARKSMKKKEKGEMKKHMKALFTKRNGLAHPPDQNIPGDEFERIREGGLKVDAGLEKLKLASELASDSILPYLGDVMVSCSLRYDMGNAGDIIKHGVLAEFAEWWNGPLRFADPFGGRPWGVAKKEVREQRMWPIRNSGCALWRAQEVNNRIVDGGLEKYYGSSHVVLNVVRESATVFASDYDKLTRNDLRAAGRIRELRGLSSTLKLIEDEIGIYDPRDGYSILNPECAKDFNLILIDPYADFLRDELAAIADKSEENGNFHKIKEAIHLNDHLWAAVFVLMKGDDQVRTYNKLREEWFKECFIALRCPRFQGRKVPAGESDYDMEILLVSKRLADNASRIKTLRKNIAKFKMAAENALGEGKIQAWGLDED